MRILVVVMILMCLWSCTEDNRDPFASYQLADESLHLSMVVQEPTIVAPVAIDFDTKGRMWVAEMPDYMPDINGEKESIPAGRIVILEDTDRDGKMDKSKVFMENIHHLRSIKLYKGGILFADNPNLYFADIIDDQPANQIIIDSTYALGGNIEHKPNSLLYNLDNCIYSAKSHYRYCFENGSWSKEATSFRGQWGLTQDENGRLYSNDNSNFLIGDQFLPNTVIANQFQHQPEGQGRDLVKDRSLFPLHATAVNRGYTEGALDSSGRVKATTSACGPHIYLSDNLGSEYNGNGFVCAPEGNLVKRLDLSQNAFLPEAPFYYSNKEFLASTDEAFRPVNVSTGPNGDLYIVDFHRGIIQHKIYMTKYLKEKIQDRKLDEVVDYGRIIRISKKGSEYNHIEIDTENEVQLVKNLSSPNGWLRMKSHEILVDLDSDELKESLYQLLEDGSKHAKLHALWILNARNAIDINKIKALNYSDPWLLANLFKIMKDLDIATNEKLDLYKKYIDTEEPIVQNHLLTSLSEIYDSQSAEFTAFLKAFPEALGSAVIAAHPSGVKIEGEEEHLISYNQNVAAEKVYYIFDEKERGMSNEGYDLYNSYCSSCHGFGGQGLEGLAPALEGGKLINENVTFVPLIILNGLQGSITLNGNSKTFSSVMPAFNLEEEEIQKISNYIYNAFSDNVKRISAEEVEQLVDKFGEKAEMWTEDALLGTEF